MPRVDIIFLQTHMDLTNLTFVDVETTGLSPQFDRIIEIGLIRMKKGKVQRTYSSLVNPESSLSPEITMLTGITPKDLEHAPSFSSIARDIEDLLSGTLFVAHNARFDYSFIKSEFSRIDKTFTSELLCTAKLSRKLFPRFRSHNLDSIIDRFSLTCTERHRALGDAEVLAQFMTIMKKQFDTTVLSNAITYVTKTASLPKSITKETMTKLPESPGVYIFYGQGGAPLYIGKSVNIKERVRSHFYNYSVSGSEAKIFQTIESMETIKTSGELGALLLESQMIKDLSPLYNRHLRKNDARIALFMKETDDGYYAIEQKNLADVSISDIDKVLSVYKSKRSMTDSLTELAREYSLCKKLLGLEKTNRSCFGSQIGTCNGACTGTELPIKYNIRFIEAFTPTKIKRWPFPGPITIREGDTTHVIHQWCYIGEMKNIDETNNFEECAIFDYDVYKILARHLLKTVRDANIHVLKPRIDY